MYFKCIRQAKALTSCKSWHLILFFLTVAFGMNFRPFVNKLAWVSVKLVLLGRVFFIKLLLLFVRELFNDFLHSLHLFVFICVVVSSDFPVLALSLWVVLTHDSVNRHVYFLAFLLLTAAFSVDSSVGTFSESIPRKSARFVTLMSTDSGLLYDLFVLKPLLGVSFQRVFPFSL